MYGVVYIVLYYILLYYALYQSSHWLPDFNKHLVYLVNTYCIRLERVKMVSKGQYICIAPYCRTPTSKVLRYGNALSRDHTVLPAYPRVYPRTEWTIPAFAFPAKAGTHLPMGWKAELAWATRTVSKQSAQDCYAMFIAAADRSKHHDSLGK